MSLIGRRDSKPPDADKCAGPDGLSFARALTIAIGIARAKPQNGMKTDEKKTLVVHRDKAWRDRATTMLQRRGLACAGLGRWHDRPDTALTSDISAVVLQVPEPCEGPVAELIASVHQRLAKSVIIAVVPPGDSATTREAFRAGAGDCFEESAGLDQLVESVVEALEPLVATRLPRPRRASGRDEDETGLPADTAFRDSLASLRGICQRHGESLSIMMFDVHRLHDGGRQYASAVGDRISDWFAAILGTACRRSDCIARYQADRFVAALPDSRAFEATELAGRCRRLMWDEPLIIEGDVVELAVSVGIAESTAGFVETEQQLIQRARIALEQAKRRGPDSTVTWNELINARPSHHDLCEPAIEDVSHWASRLREHLKSTYVESTRALVAAVEAKDPYTQKHSFTVAAYAEAIGKRMKLAPRMVETLRAAALLHDVGKIGVPDAILTKPGPLTEKEFEVIKRHPEIALEILGHVSYLTDERPLILHHHERYDGTGYPDGLAGDRIPIGARILAVADALDTMFAPRSYKEPYPLSRVRAELTAGAGSQFDPQVAEAALGWLDDACDPSSQGPPPLGT